MKTEVAGQRDHVSESAAKHFAAAWVRRDFLSYLKPADEPVWQNE